MSEQIDVSIVMSVYNDAAYLREAVESILRQEGVSFEFIVIDDGSTDGSGRILDEYAAKDSRLRVVHQQNQGLTRALIAGCALARGRYIARQDSDDISFPERLEKLSTDLDRHRDAVLAASRIVLMGPNGEMLHKERGASSACYSDQSTFCHGSLIFRRDAYFQVGGYRHEFRAAQDVDLQLRLAEAGRFRLLPDLLYAHRIDGTSISACSPIQRQLSRLAQEASKARSGGLNEQVVLEEAASMSSHSPRGNRIEPGTGNYFVGRCLYARRDRRALSYLWRALRSDPVSWRVWLAIAQAALLTKSNLGQNVGLLGIGPSRESEPTSYQQTSCRHR